MIVRPVRAGFFSTTVLIALWALPAWAARPSDSVLPATTKGYLSVPNVDKLLEQFNKSQLGQLVNNPQMQPFVEDFKRQLRQKGLKQLEQLGLSWEELEGVPAGEVALAIVQPAADEAAVALVVDVTGRREKAQAVLAKVGERMNRNGAKRMRRTAGDPIVAYQLPSEQGRKLPPYAAYFLQQDLLVASDSIPVIEAMLAALQADRKDTLANVEAYRQIMALCGTAATGVVEEPNLRWFLEPFGYAETLRAATPLRDKRKGPDLVKVFRNQGFTAIQGVGGYVNFAAGKFELLHRTAIYAPPVAARDAASKDKYTLAARMLRFPAQGSLLPQDWVPRDVATYASFNWDMQTAFAAAETLVDELVGEKGVFRDVLESLRDDPDGPRVDIEKNIVAHLGSRATIITDNELPIGPKCERKVLAAEVTDEVTVAAAINKLMESEKDAHRHEFAGAVIWEIVDRESEVPALEIETPGGDVEHSESGEAAKRPQREERLLPTSTICVAHGHLFLGSHVNFMQKILQEVKQSGDLGQEADFRMIADQAKALGAGELSLRMFSRTDEDFRPTYELIRTGQMPQSQSILGQILNSILGEGKEGAPRKQRIDGSQLPDYEVVRRYLGPAGLFVTSLDDGWMCVGFWVAKEPRVASEDPPAAAGSSEVSASKEELSVRSAELARP